MRKRAVLPLLGAMALLILDSRCAAQSARDALELCLQTLVPTLFPLMVLSAMLVPRLSEVRVPGLAWLLGLPEGSDGIVLLGCGGGFPVGAACVAQAAQSGALGKEESERMLGLCSFCGPGFLFGIVGTVLSMEKALMIFCIQLEVVLLTALFCPDTRGTFRGSGLAPVSMNDALKQAAGSMVSVCGWVILAGVAAGFFRRWAAPLLPGFGGTVLVGLMELTTGVFSLRELPTEELRFVACTSFVCFGGVSVLLQIGALAAPSGLRLAPCAIQKAVQGLLGAVLAAGVMSFGPIFLLVGLAPGAVKIAVEISGRMVYNVGRKEGI